MENPLNLKKYSFVCEKGPFLDLNEDDIDIDLKNDLFMVIDGFGGGNIGQETSRKIKEIVSQYYSKITGDSDATMPFFFHSKYLLEGNALINGLLKAQKIIYNENKSKDLSSRGGASIVSAVLSDNIMTFVSVGNCCSILIRDRGIQFISSPDSYEVVLSNGHQKFFANFPLNGLGLFDVLSFDIKELKLFQGDVVLMLTDGAYNRLKLSELNNIFSFYNLNNKQKIKRIFDLVNGRGNHDNQSCLVLEF
jgi:serine/threonine protein phosphatase PrpC